MHDAPARPLVYIAVLDHNGLADTLECLASLSALEYRPYELFLIDNGSGIPCAPEVGRRFPRVRTIRREKNLGFAGGCNVVMRKALAEGAGYVWLLNNDTAADPKALAALVEAAESDPRCGIAGSKIYFYQDRMRLQHAGAGLNMEDGRFFHRGYPLVDEGQFDRAEEVYFVTGCSLLAKAAMIREVGLLDEMYVSYFEDIDWCVRARRAGWRVRYIPSSVIYHKVSATTGGWKSPRYVFYYSRNYLMFFMKNYPSLFPRALGVWWVRDFIREPARARAYSSLAAGLLGMLDMWRATLWGCVRRFLGRGGTRRPA